MGAVKRAFHNELEARRLLEDEGSCQEVTKQIREWREEDRRAGILWADNKQSERDGA